MEGFLRSPGGEINFFEHLTDLNENGWAVGWTSVADQAHGFLWNPETETTVDIGAVEADAPLFLLGDGIVVATVVRGFQLLRVPVERAGRTNRDPQSAHGSDTALDHAAGRIVGERGECDDDFECS